MWNCTARFINGRLFQRRVSEKYGVLYDTRVIFEKVNLDKLHLTDEYVESQNNNADAESSLIISEEVPSTDIKIDGLVQVLRVRIL